MQKIYAIFDTVSQMIVGQLLLCRHDAQAVRAFSDIINDKQQNMLNQHPDDFQLLCLGTILENTDDAYTPVEVQPLTRAIIQGSTIAALKNDTPQSPDAAPISLANSHE